jgi:hypothetical protein
MLEFALGISLVANVMLIYKVRQLNQVIDDDDLTEDDVMLNRAMNVMLTEADRKLPG